MSNMLITCELFCQYSKMELTPSKSCSVAYIINNNMRYILTNNCVLNNEPIPYVDSEESFKYLGVPITIINFVQTKFIE